VIKTIAVGVVTSLVAASAALGQSVLERSPNIQGVWGAERGEAVFVLAHRFEIMNGGDELFSVPTLTLAAGLPLGLTLGVDYTSFSEVVPDELTGNEAQYWLKRGFALPAGARAAILGVYKTAAESAEGAVDLRLVTRILDLYTEGRAHSRLFGRDDFGLSGTIGAGVHINRYLAITGDVGRVLTEDSIPGAWSAAVAVAIPGSPHTLSFHIANSGATTLQGVSREKTVGSKDTRRGFTFTVPLGNGSRWARIFRPAAVPPVSSSADVIRVTMQGSAFAPRETRVRVGQQVEWVNLDPVTHTVTADDLSWDSGRMEEGAIFTRTFTEPGRYSYFCQPHAGMVGVVVVEP
jgi:plastocyanin